MNPEEFHTRLNHLQVHRGLDLALADEVATTRDTSILEQLEAATDADIAQLNAAYRLRQATFADVGAMAGDPVYADAHERLAQAKADLADYSRELRRQLGLPDLDEDAS